ncbi:DUF5063 domain-containing protein [Roseiconus lacunae]|uniref:DUF5063 domain-containing protein n=1 Tax=Roseiconus lacunae TaxID=2605694 RepID=A0ABT7PSM9_9BACT|nr:DUF5063 domain-containing protein [Roseiconus lacunae]MDM4019460.1 DUF5063 domain-containing protein [Roseiconus lacunae]
MSPAIEAFIDNVNRYCEWHESDSHEIEAARQILLALMQGIPALDTTRLDTSCSTEYEFRGHERWKDDHKRLADLPIQYYRAVFYPLQFENEESVVGDLHDDLADIYGDLWHGLQGYNAGDIGYAIDHWRTSYDQHWGHHAAAAMFAIDAYYRS